MKRLLFFFAVLVMLHLQLAAQKIFLSDIKTKGEIRYSDDFATIPLNYWRFDSCLYGNSMCRYNTSTAARINVQQTGNTVRWLFLKSNNSGYKSKHMDDSLTGVFFPTRMNNSFWSRKIYLDKGSNIKEDIYLFRTDTFQLTVIDSFVLSSSLIKKVFGRLNQSSSLHIYVLQSKDADGSDWLLFWTEQMGIVKMTNEKCWRYSFELNDTRTKATTKLFSQMMRLIKTRYKDPYWKGDPCSFE